MPLCPGGNADSQGALHPGDTCGSLLTPAWKVEYRLRTPSFPQVVLEAELLAGPNLSTKQGSGTHMCMTWLLQGSRGSSVYHCALLTPGGGGGGGGETQGEWALASLRRTSFPEAGSRVPDAAWGRAPALCWVLLTLPCWRDPSVTSLHWRETQERVPTRP